MSTTFAELERQKAETLRSVEEWPADRLRFRPVPESWSIAEILDHVVKVEQGIFAEVRRGLLAPHRIGLRDRVGVLFIQRLFRSNRRVRVPFSARHILPEAEPDVAAVLARWDVSRKELAELLDHLPLAAMRYGVFRHPVAGWMRVPQVLDFFAVHLHHHGFQMQRLRGALAAAGPSGHAGGDPGR